MDEYENLVASLKQELEAKEKDIYLAATYGKQLLHEKEQLCKRQEDLLSHIEILKQSGHSLQLTTDANEKIIKIQVAEIESLKDSLENVSCHYEELKKDNLLISKKCEELKKENCELKKSQDDLASTGNKLRKEIELLEEQVRDYQDLNQSLNETFCSEEYQKIKNELASIKEEKVNLQLALQETQCELDAKKNNEVKFFQKIEELEVEVLDKDKEISTYSVLVEKVKEESNELRGEIEILKLEQVDVNRRGNSIFGELDDRRVQVEERYRELRDKYRNREEQFAENVIALRQTKNQLASALAYLSIRKIDAKYIDELESGLHSSKREIAELTQRLIKEERRNKETIKLPQPEEKISHKNLYEHMKDLLEYSQKRVKKLEEDLTLARTQKVLDNTKLMEIENRIYFSEKDAAIYRAAAMKYKLKIDELMNKDKENKVYKVNEEVIPGFVKKSEGSEKECHKSSDAAPQGHTSESPQILSSTSAKLNPICSHKGNGPGVSSIASCRECQIFKATHRTNKNKPLNENSEDNSMCIQQ